MPSLEKKINSNIEVDTTVILAAPKAKKIPHKLLAHQTHRIDNYYWMRDDSRTHAEVIAHLSAENDYADQLMKPQKALKQQIFDELKSRIVKDDNSVPVQDGHYWYHSEISGDQEFPSFFRAESFSGKNKQLLLDVQLRSEQHEYYELGDISISPNDQILSFSEDAQSRRIYSIFFKDLNTGKLLDDVLEETEGQVAWSADNRTVFYVKKDPQTLLGNQVFSHRLGTLQCEDKLVYQLDDSQFYLGLGNSRDDSKIFIGLNATETSHYLAIDADHPDEKFTPLLDLVTGHEFELDKLGDDYFILTNWNAKNFRIMKATEAQLSDREQWQEVISHRDEVLVEGMELFNNHLVISERENGQIRFVVLDKQGQRLQIAFQDPCYYASIADNPEPKSQSVRIYYSSLTTPASLYEVCLVTGEKKLLKQQQVLGDFDSNNYRSERVYVNARDGIKVPVSLVYRKDQFNKDGSNPLYQYGYGAYGITIDPSFSSSILSLLDRGFVYAIAHVRGSEMLGRDWYEAGKKLHKKNSFNDFIDVSHALVEQGYAARDKVFASGGSAGGLLVGAVINQAPELYRAVASHVPFVDVVTTMSDESIPLTTNEYDEWGNPADFAYFKYMLEYSPYDNVIAQDYPHILITTGFHDSQVQYFEPMKWVAKLRELKTDDNKLVFKTDMDAGHGGASGRFKSLQDKALEYAFFVSLTT